MTRATHSHLLGVLGSILAAPLLACEFSKQLDPDGVAEGSSGATGSTADDGETSGTTAGSSGGASLSSTSGTAGDDTPGGELSCDPGTAVLTWTIDGVQSTLETEPAGLGTNAIGMWAEIPNDGAMYVRFVVVDPERGPVETPGYVRLPSDAPSDADSWLCFDETSTYTSDDDHAQLQLNGLARLGPCPGGVPVEGNVTACLGDPSCGGEMTLDATLGVESFSEPISDADDTSWGSVVTHQVAFGRPQQGTGGGQVGFRVAAVDGDGTQILPIEAPYFIVPLDQPDGGAVYCGGAGSSMTAVDGELVSVELVDLTRLGSCADGEATGYGAYCSELGT